jgi:hypothetical protein
MYYRCTAVVCLLSYILTCGAQIRLMASLQLLLEAIPSQDFQLFSSIAIFLATQFQLIPSVVRPMTIVCFVFPVLTLAFNLYSHGCFAIGGGARVSASGSDV